ncbi:MAG: molybdate ABC transporter substrate-binding protein [Microbacterium sp.]
MPHPRAHRRNRLAGLAVCAIALPLVGGCAATVTPAQSGTAGPSGPLTIFAAASLRGAFDELAARFEQRHPAVDVRPISYDGSSTLATQLIEGAPADVFASADEQTMDAVVGAGRAASSEVFASNTLVLVVPADVRGAVETLEDLADPALTVVLCAPAVPCGAASVTLLDAAGVEVEPASLEQNVTAVLTKVAAGEADAGLVYATDVRGRDDVRAVVPPSADRVVNRYPIAALGDAGNPGAAEAFAAFVLSDAGRAVLDDFGFGAP